MSESQPSNAELVHHLEPWFPLLGRVVEHSMQRHKIAVPILGLPRRTERANDLHRAIRESFRAVADHADPLIELKEEPEGQGLDYLIWRIIPDRPFTMRWGRHNGGTIRRNRTHRTREIQEQTLLFGSSEADEQSTAMPTCSLSFTIEDDYTEVGVPKWWIGRLYLVRERAVQSEVVTEAWVYQPPAEDAAAFEAPPPVVAAREAELQEWGEMIADIRQNFG